MPTGIYKRSPTSAATKDKIASALLGNTNSGGKQNALGKTWRLSPESRDRQRAAQRSRPLAETCSYGAAHIWLSRHATKTGACEACAVVAASARHTHWANISGSNLRSRDDYWELCVRCHKLFDYMRIIGMADPGLVAILAAKRAW